MSLVSKDVLNAIRSAAWRAARLPLQTHSRLGIHEAVNSAIASVSQMFNCTAKHEWPVFVDLKRSGRLDVVWFERPSGIIAAAFETDTSGKEKSLIKLTNSGAALKVLVSYSTKATKHPIPEGVLWLRLGIWRNGH